MVSAACGSGESSSSLLILAIYLIGSSFSWGCGAPDVKPVELYPEDMCAFCRMAVSDHRCASEIITNADEVFKFDDIACLERFMHASKDLEIAAVFVKNYETKEWLPLGSAVVIATDLMTPMGSGKLAFADSSAAERWLDKRAKAGSGGSHATTQE